MHSFSQLAESEVRAVTGGAWQGYKVAEKCVFNLRLNALADCEMRIFRGRAFQICEAA